MSIMSLSIPIPLRNLSFSRVLTGPDNAFLETKLSQLSLGTAQFPAKTTLIRMGGGPRTYPGGVSKWQWKRMQAKKAKQLLKARLCRERQMYEMRKRAELKAAVSELERPWEVVERAPTLLSVSADEQLKVLADRFQRPDGIKPYEAREMAKERDGFRKQVDLKNSMDEEGNSYSGKGGNGTYGKSRKRRTRKRIGSTANSSNFDFDGGQGPTIAQRLEYSDSEFYDMSLQQDGSYGFEAKSS
ncbi:putative DEAD-box ATP-dependent RNA helicase 48 [Vitis vinifera]|uniref:Putative DEAD-box ATP-dependent RNA helicase 48 n=1 Tax=Vitis vinifera TaxID=29760 RepID=A0A438JAF4_VITVI|nr:putative DEAD-box ATP-dependent RNA helicase 48 [Vitis vinifera]